MKQAKDVGTLHKAQCYKAAYSGRTVPEFHRSSLFTLKRKHEKGSPQAGRYFTPQLRSVNSNRVLNAWRTLPASAILNCHPTDFHQAKALDQPRSRILSNNARERSRRPGIRQKLRRNFLLGPVP